MEYMEVGLCFVIGAAIILLIGYSLRIKKKTVRVIILNSLIGGGFFALLSVSKLLYLPLSPLSMLVCGVFGLPGAVMIVIFTLFIG